MAWEAGVSIITPKEERINGFIDKEAETISIEISPACNIKCPECIVANRLSSPRSDPELVKLIIEHMPQNAKLSFVGLGEPLIPSSQEKIAQILETRPDIVATVQSNGTYQLTDKVKFFTNNGRLKVGVSYDQHHIDGGQKIYIDPGYVSHISEAVKGKDDVSINYAVFSSLERALIIPLTKREKIIPTWKDLELILNQRNESLGDSVLVFSYIPEEYRNYNENKIFFEEMDNRLITLNIPQWKVTREGIYIRVKDNPNERKVLNDGYIVYRKNYHCNHSWESMDKYSFQLKEIFPKIFDIETKTFTTLN